MKVALFFTFCMYVITWVAVVFGIDCASNAGRKLVVKQDSCITRAIPNTTANYAIIN